MKRKDKLNEKRLEFQNLYKGMLKEKYDLSPFKSEFETQFGKCLNIYKSRKGLNLVSNTSRNITEATKLLSNSPCPNDWNAFSYMIYDYALVTLQKMWMLQEVTN